MCIRQRREDDLLSMGDIRRRDRVVFLVLLCAVLGGAAVVIRQAERAAVEDAVADAGRASRDAGEVARVGRAVRAMQLITVSLDTTVSTESRAESWRGNVNATITAPLRLLYGVDLENARVRSVDLGPLSRGFYVLLPQPRRLGTELRTDGEAADVNVGWLRFRSMAGEFHLGRARTALSAAADKLELSQAQQGEVRDETRRRVEELVRSITGAGKGREQDQANVVVRFEGEDPGVTGLLIGRIAQ